MLLFACCCCVISCAQGVARQAPATRASATQAAPGQATPTQGTPTQALPAQKIPAPAPSGPVAIKVDVNAVLVPVVARNARGRAVGDLRKEDFEVFDRGKLQVISGFTVEKRPAREIDTEPSTPEAGGPNVGRPATPAPGDAPQRFIVFLFDDLHLSAADLAQVQRAATRMLAGALSDLEMADVVSFSGTNSGMTRDRAKLQEAIMKLSARGLYRQSGRQCPNVDYYLADLIANKHNEQATESAVQDAMTCANLKPEQRNLAESMVRSAASQALANGDQDTRVSLTFIKELVHRMEALPGERMVILVSPGFMANSAEAMALKSQIMDVAAQSQVTVSALDARGLYTTNLDASQHGDTSTFAMMTGQTSQHHGESMAINEDVLAELADGTGGTFFHNSNDLEGGFNRLTEVPEYLYLLTFSPENIKANGSYHSLRVKVHRDGLKVQTRSGYYAPKAENAKK